MNFKIGKLKNGADVIISKSSPNTHVILSGISGSGKTIRIRQMIRKNRSPGQTTLIFDLDGKTYEGDEENVNRIDAAKDGIALRLLDPTILEADDDVYVNYVSFITDILTNTTRLGVRQQGSLRDAVEYALNNLDKYPSDMEAIVAGLELQDSSVAQGVYNKLWNLLKCGVFRPSQKHIKPGTINVISFEGIASSTQKVLVEILLGTLWRRLQFSGEGKEKLFVVIDEFQKIYLEKNAIILEMLRESRKYEVSIILATQSIASLEKKTHAYIHQAAVQLYFQQSAPDRKKVASIIAPNNPDHWTLMLQNLQIGESVAIGNLAINGQEFVKPLLIQSDYEPQTTFIAERGN